MNRQLCELMSIRHELNYKRGLLDNHVMTLCNTTVTLIASTHFKTLHERLMNLSLEFNSVEEHSRLTRLRDEMLQELTNEIDRCKSMNA